MKHSIHSGKNGRSHSGLKWMGNTGLIGRYSKTDTRCRNNEQKITPDYSFVLFFFQAGAVQAIRCQLDIFLESQVLTTVVTRDSGKLIPLE